MVSTVVVEVSARSRRDADRCPLAEGRIIQRYDHGEKKIFYFGETDKSVGGGYHSGADQMLTSAQTEDNKCIGG